MGQERENVEYLEEGEGGGSGGHCGTAHWALEAGPGQGKQEKEQEKEELEKQELKKKK